MKQAALTILALFSLILAGITQPAELLNHTWKMEKIITVYAGKTTTFFHKDSLSNKVNYSSAKYNFFSNGTYSVTSDTTSGQGAWALNTNLDSAVIDSVTYFLSELSAAHFTTRGFTQQVADSTGTLDTAFTFVVMYPVSALPVSLISFTGKYINNQVKLSWSTANGKLSKEFRLQYSADGLTFANIGVVPSRSNGVAAADYIFNTSRFQNGKNYYRIIEVGFDGNTTASPVSIVSIDPSRQLVISLSPNPAFDKLQLFMSQPATGSMQLVLATLTGRQVWNRKLAGNAQATTVNLPPLARGVYIASVINSKGEKIFSEKLIIQ